MRDSIPFSGFCSSIFFLFIFSFIFPITSPKRVGPWMFAATVRKNQNPKDRFSSCRLVYCFFFFFF